MKIPQLSKRMTYVFAICVSFFAVLILLYIFPGRPAIKFLNKQKKEFNAKQQKLKESEELIKTLPNPQKAIEEIEKKVAEIKEMGVSKKQFPRIIQMLGISANEHGINVISLKPRDDIKTGSEALPAGVTRVYVEMVISGTYRRIGDFVKILNELPTPFSIENINIEKQEENKEAPGGGEPKKAQGQAGAKIQEEELVCTLLLSTYMVWEI